MKGKLVSIISTVALAATITFGASAALASHEEQSEPVTATSSIEETVTCNETTYLISNIRFKDEDIGSKTIVRALHADVREENSNIFLETYFTETEKDALVGFRDQEGIWLEWYGDGFAGEKDGFVDAIDVRDTRYGNLLCFQVEGEVGLLYCNGNYPEHLGKEIVSNAQNKFKLGNCLLRDIYHRWKDLR